MIRPLFRLAPLALRVLAVCLLPAQGRDRLDAQQLPTADVPTPATPATFDPDKGKQGPPRYVNVSIVGPSDPDLTWAKEQLKADGFAIPWLGMNEQ